MWELGYSLVRFMHSVPDIADPEGTSQQLFILSISYLRSCSYLYGTESSILSVADYHLSNVHVLP